MITQLIDKQDTFEIVRDKVALILANEVASQMALAVGEGKDPALWDLRIYTERANNWEQWLNSTSDQAPIVNIWYETSNFDAPASNISERQKADAVFNIDCYGFGISADVAGGGHSPGDKAAASNAQRANRLVRNILMSAEYAFLGLRKTVWSRWIPSITMFQPEIGGNPIQQIMGSRLVLSVAFNEYSPQYEPETLEEVHIDIKRKEDGQVIAEVEFDYTT